MVMVARKIIVMGVKAVEGLPTQILKIEAQNFFKGTLIFLIFVLSRNLNLFFRSSLKCRFLKKISF